MAVSSCCPMICVKLPEGKSKNDKNKKEDFQKIIDGPYLPYRGTLSFILDRKDEDPKDEDKEEEKREYYMVIPPNICPVHGLCCPNSRMPMVKRLESNNMQQMSQMMCCMCGQPHGNEETPKSFPFTCGTSNSKSVGNPDGDNKPMPDGYPCGNGKPKPEGRSNLGGNVKPKSNGNLGGNLCGNSEPKPDKQDRSSQNKKKNNIEDDKSTRKQKLTGQNSDCRAKIPAGYCECKNGNEDNASNGRNLDNGKGNGRSSSGCSNGNWNADNMSNERNCDNGTNGNRRNSGCGNGNTSNGNNNLNRQDVGDGCSPCMPCPPPMILLTFKTKNKNNS